jgi:hypothetical protein
MDVPRHSHPEIEDRITLEIGALRGDIAALDGRMRQGFTQVVQAIAQLAALMEGGDDG